jgi:hypothetical protein
LAEKKMFSLSYIRFEVFMMRYDTMQSGRRVILNWRNIPTPSSGNKMGKYVSQKRWYGLIRLHGVKTQRTILVTTFIRIVLWSTDTLPKHYNISEIFSDVSTNQPTNSVALVRERTIPTERPPLVGKLSANLCRYGRNLGFLDRTSLEQSHKVLH